MPANEHSIYSSYREILLEHLQAGEVMRYLWLIGVTRIEVLKPQVDDGGYDLVLEAKNIVRHVQLKSSHNGSKTRMVNVNTALAKKTSGCVVWIQFDPATLTFKKFYWYGGAPGAPLPSLNNFKIAKHTRGNAKGFKAERPNLRVISQSKFQKLDSIGSLVKHLFG